MIDENGRYIGEEYTLAICVNHVLQQNAGAGRDELFDEPDDGGFGEKYDVPFYRSAVGEANVVDCMLKHGAVIGGEGNGGVIDPRVVLVRDSFTAMALILDAMAARNCRSVRWPTNCHDMRSVKRKSSCRQRSWPADLRRWNGISGRQGRQT